MEDTPPAMGELPALPCAPAVGDASPAEGSLHGSTPPAMGELPALPCAPAVGDASPAEGSLHGSTPPAMGELPALPCAPAVGDASPAEGSLHGSTPPAMGELPALPCAPAVGDASPAEGSCRMPIGFGRLHLGRGHGGAGHSGAPCWPRWPAGAEPGGHGQCQDRADAGEDACAAPCRHIGSTWAASPPPARAWPPSCHHHRKRLITGTAPTSTTSFPPIPGARPIATKVRRKTCRASSSIRWAPIRPKAGEGYNADIGYVPEQGDGTAS